MHISSRTSPLATAVRRAQKTTYLESDLCEASQSAVSSSWCSNSGPERAAGLSNVCAAASLNYLLFNHRQPVTYAAACSSIHGWVWAWGFEVKGEMWSTHISVIDMRFFLETAEDAKNKSGDDEDLGLALEADTLLWNHILCDRSSNR